MRYQITWIKRESTTYRATIDVAEDLGLSPTAYFNQVMEHLQDNDCAGLEPFEDSDHEVRCSDGYSVLSVVPT